MAQLGDIFSGWKCVDRTKTSSIWRQIPLEPFDRDRIVIRFDGETNWYYGEFFVEKTEQEVLKKAIRLRRGWTMSSILGEVKGSAK